MPNNTTKILSSKTGDASLKRPKFSTGLLLQDDDLTQTVDYMREMTRLLFKSMLGCGVLCGFKIEPSIVCSNTIQILVRKGIALDCGGELIELQNDETLKYTPPCSSDAIEFPPEIWVVICRKERDCVPRDVLCSAQDGEIAPVYTRTREGFEIKLIEATAGENAVPACCSCGSVLLDTQNTSGDEDCCDNLPITASRYKLQKCYQKHYDGECSCDCECDCIVLAKVIKKEDPDSLDYDVDHSVRRYVRPALLKDPLLEEDQKRKAENQSDKPAAPSSTPSSPIAAVKKTKPNKVNPS